MPEDVGHVGFEQQEEPCLPVDHIVNKSLVIGRAVDLTCYVDGVGVIVLQILGDRVGGERRLQLLDIVRACRRRRQHLIMDIVGIQTASAFGEDTAPDDLGGVADHDAVVVVNDIGDHVVLLREHLFVEYLGHLLVIIFRFRTEQDQVAACGRMGDRSGEVYKALSSRFTAAVGDKGRRRSTLVEAIHQPLDAEAFFISSFVNVQQQTLPTDVFRFFKEHSLFIGVIEVDTARFLDQTGGQVAAKNRQAGIGGIMQIFQHRVVYARAAVAFLLREVLLGDVADKYVEHVAVSRELGKVTVVIDPSDTAVLADDAVFYMIAVGGILTVDLLPDRLIDLLIVLGMHHSPEGVSRQLAEFFLVFASVHVQHGVVDIQKFHTGIGAIDKKAARYLLSDPFDRRGQITALIQLICFGH